MTAREKRLVEQAANEIVQRFSARLRFDDVYDRFFVSDHVVRLRHGNPFEGVFANDLVQSLSAHELRETYTGFMQNYYIRLLYEYSVGCRRAVGSDEQVCEPKQVTELLAKSKFKDLISATGSDTDEGVNELHSRAHLRQYLKELTDITASYRIHLPKNVFRSERYIENTHKQAGKKASKVAAYCGFPSMEDDPRTKVFTIEKDIFVLFLREQDGQMKVLGTGFD